MREMSQAGWPCVLCRPRLGLDCAVRISFDLTPTRSSGSRHLETLQSYLSLLSFISCCSSFYKAVLNLFWSVPCLLSWSEEDCGLQCRKSDYPGSRTLLTGWQLGSALSEVTETSPWGENQPASLNEGLGYSRPCSSKCSQIREAVLLTERVGFSTAH